MKVKKRKCLVLNYSLIFFDRDLTFNFLFNFSNDSSPAESEAVQPDNAANLQPANAANPQPHNVRLNNPQLNNNNNVASVQQDNVNPQPVPPQRNESQEA